MLARQLHDAARYLAGVCDGAHALDGMGYAAADARFGRFLARTPPRAWDACTGTLAHEMLHHYRGQLVRAGIDLPVFEPGRVDLDRSEISDDLREKIWLEWDTEHGLFTGRSDRPPPQSVLDQLKLCPGRRWNEPVAYAWNIPNTAYGRGVLDRMVEAGTLGWYDPDAIPPPPEEDPDEVPPGKMRAHLEDGRCVWTSHPQVFPGWDVLGQVKSLPRESARRVKGEDGGDQWESVVPIDGETAERILDLLELEPFYATEDLVVELEAAFEREEKFAGLSRAADAEFYPDGIEASPHRLFGYQKAGVAYASEARRAVIADDMGLGKTAQAIATVAHLDAWPLVVTCPASLKINWQREIAMWTGREAVILAGTKETRLPADADAVIVNHDILWSWRSALYKGGFNSLVIDESHRFKSGKAKRSKVAAHLAKRMRDEGDAVQLLLTGTPVVNMPSDLITQLRILDRLSDLGGWGGFTRRYCIPKQRFGGFERGGRNLEELNERMRASFYIRREKKDVLGELPPKLWAEAPIALDDFAKRQYRDAIDEIKKRFGEDTVSPIQLIGVARRALAEAKLPLVLEWIRTFAESGEKLVIFGHHRSVTEGLAAELDCPAIHGGISQEDRQAAVDAFQTDPAVQFIVCSIAAGGVGLTLTAASNVAFVEFGWTPMEMDQAIDRCHRIGQEDSVTGWELFATGIPGGTIDEWTRELIATKRATVDVATQGEAGDLAQAKEATASALLAKILGRSADAEFGIRTGKKLPEQERGSLWA